MGLDGECRLPTGDGYTVQLVYVNQTLTATTNAFSVDVDATEASMWLVVLLLALAVAFCSWWCRRHRRLRRPAVPVAQLYETGNEADACTTTSYAVAHGDKTTPTPSRHSIFWYILQNHPRSSCSWHAGCS